MESPLAELLDASIGPLSRGIVRWSDGFGSTEFVVSDLFPEARWVVTPEGLTRYREGEPATL